MGLGVGQCVNRGVLYYAFAVLVPSLERELGVATWVVTGAFSVALLMSAFLAPAVGRWSDSDRGALVMQIGGFGAAVLLAAWTLLPGVLSLYNVERRLSERAGRAAAAVRPGARAFVAAWLASVVGYATILAVIAATLTAVALMSGRAFRNFQSHHTREETI